MLYNYELGLSPKAKTPQVLAHLDTRSYERIIEKTNGSHVNQDFYEVRIVHEYVSDCEQFNYLIFFLTPTIAFTVVLRIAYIYKCGKVIKHH